MIQNDEHERWDIVKCGNVNGLYLIIYTNDSSNIPHFHIYNNQEPNKTTLNVCLKIETPEYFKHGHHIDILNRKQIKQIVTFLNSKRSNNLTYWHHLIMLWNDNNSKYSIPEDMKMPDYMSLIK